MVANKDDIAYAAVQQETQPDSVLSFWKRGIALRREQSDLFVSRSRELTFGSHVVLNQSAITRFTATSAYLTVTTLRSLPTQSRDLQKLPPMVNGLLSFSISAMTHAFGLSQTACNLERSCFPTIGT